MLHRPCGPLTEKNAHIKAFVGVGKAARRDCRDRIFLSEVDSDGTEKLISPWHEAHPVWQVCGKLLRNTSIEKLRLQNKRAEVEFQVPLFQKKSPMVPILSDIFGRFGGNVNLDFAEG